MSGGLQVGGIQAEMTELAAVRTGERISRLAAQMHAIMAELVGLAAEFDEGRGWDGCGIRSCAHWLAINAGTDVWTGMEMVRVGNSLRELPLLAEAFASGELSFDKLRHVTRVAKPADEELWLEVARHASGSQLARICRGFERASDADGLEGHQKQLARRGVRSWWRDDGMLELVAVLPPEDGAVVLAAMEKVHLDSPPPGTAQAELDPAKDPWAARRADELVEVANQWLSGVSQSIAAVATGGDLSRKLVVHVDLGALTNGDAGGTCRVEEGAILPAAVARRIGCDTELVAVAERERAPLDVGRARRTISTRQRLALQARDSTCRFPGCGVPASRTEGHHLRHWADGGRTDLDNLLSLCRFHHHRLHDGVYRIVARPAGSLRFETDDGTPIGSGYGRRESIEQLPPSRPNEDQVDPRALDGGAPCDFGYVIEALTVASGAAAAVPAGPGP